MRVLPETVVFAYLDEPPFCAPGDREPAGCDVELARWALSGAGVRDVEMRLTTFAELIPGLIDGRWHMTTGLFVTKERARLVDFSRPIWALPDGLMVRAGNPLALDGYEAIARHARARLAVVADQVQHLTARQAGVPDSRILVAATQDEAARAVQRGEADAYASVATAHRGYLERSGAGEIALVPIAQDKAGGAGALGAFAFSKQASSLRDAVGTQLERVLGTPEHRRLMARFGFARAEIDRVPPR